MSGSSDGDSDGQTDDQRAEHDDDVDRHRPELESFVTAMPARPARPATVLLGEPTGEKGARPPHHGHRRLAPRHSILTMDGRLAVVVRVTRAHRSPLSHAPMRPPRRSLPGFEACAAAWPVGCFSSPFFCSPWRPGPAAATRCVKPSSSGALAAEVFPGPSGRQLAADGAPALASTLGHPGDQLGRTVDRNSANQQAAEFLADIVAVPTRGSSGPAVRCRLRCSDGQHRARPAGRRPTRRDVAGGGGRVSTPSAPALRWFVPIAALLGLAAAALGVLTHPERAEAVFGIGVFCIFAAVLAMVLGYVVPTFLLPVLTDNIWIEVIPAVANNELRTVAGLSCALAVVGVVLIIGSASVRRRKTSWSSPVRVARYNEQRRWS